MNEFFKQVDERMYLSFNAAVESGLGSDKYLRFAKSAGRKTIQFIDDPDDLRRSLVNYDSLKQKHKELVHSWLRKKSGCKHSDGADCNCGNPYHYMTTEPVRAMIKPDLVAEAFFLEHRYSGPTGTDSLPHETIERYSLAAGILKLIAEAEKDKKSLIKDRFKTDVLGFYDIIGGIIGELKAQDKLPKNFPTDYAKLRRRVVLFNEKGYESLIDPRFGNKSAAKINDELSEAMLLELIAHPNQYDDKLVTIIYNEWAEGKGYKAIDKGTVQVWRKKREFEVMTGREGREVYNNKLRRKVLRQRPSMPTFLWESDDNHLDWWFQGDKANEYRKVKGIIVTDSFNDYVLGWAITDGEMPGDIVRMAYLNAMYHIKELTGGWYLPFELKTDQWNISQLRPFYQKLGHYYDTPVGSKNRGWLETLFGHDDWTRSLKLGYNNYTGHNITAKTRGVNMEAVRANKKVWPHISEAADQMAEFINRLRTMPRNYDKANKSRQQEWLEAWAAMPEDKKRPITREQMLLKVGFRHEWDNKITDQGIRPTIMGRSFQYAVPPALYLQNVGKRVSVIYDPYDMSQVLVTDDNNIRFMASSITPMPGCMADMKDGGRAFLNQVLNEAKADTDRITAAKERRQATLANNDFDVETIIKLGAGVMKEVKQVAEQRFLQDGIDRANYNPLSQM